MTMTVDELIAEATQLPPESQRELVLRLFIKNVVAHDPTMVEQLRQLINAAQQPETEPIPQPATDGWGDILAAAAEYRVSTGIGDLAHQHDHYLYGTPKKDAS